MALFADETVSDEICSVAPSFRDFCLVLVDRFGLVAFELSLSISSGTSVSTFRGSITSTIAQPSDRTSRSWLGSTSLLVVDGASLWRDILSFSRLRRCLSLFSLRILSVRLSPDVSVMDSTVSVSSLLTPASVLSLASLFIFAQDIAYQTIQSINTPESRTTSRDKLKDFRQIFYVSNSHKLKDKPLKNCCLLTGCEFDVPRT